MGKLIHATYRFLANRRPEVLRTFTEQAPYGVSRDTQEVNRECSEKK